MHGYPPALAENYWLGALKLSNMESSLVTTNLHFSTFLRKVRCKNTVDIILGAWYSNLPSDLESRLHAYLIEM